MEDQKFENLDVMDFFKFDLRAGTILKIEEVPKSRKLLKLEVDFGSEGIRTILSGIAPLITSSSPNGTKGCFCIVGQKVIGVLNLASRTMFDIESQGMLLASKDENEMIWLTSPGPVANGIKVS